MAFLIMMMVFLVIGDGDGVLDHGDGVLGDW